MDFHRTKLHDLISTRGVSICEDIAMLKALLSDAFRNHPSASEAKWRILTLALTAEHGVIDELTRTKSSIPYSMIADKLVDNIHASNRIEKESVRWAIDSWALAIGVISSVNFEQKDKEPASEKPHQISSPRLTIASPTVIPTSAGNPRGWAPKELKDFIGQPSAKRLLTISIDAAKQREEALGHVLLYGAEHLGKATLADVIARTLDTPSQECSSADFRTRSDLTAVLTNLRERQSVIVECIEKLTPNVADAFAEAMPLQGDELDHHSLTITIGKGDSARRHEMEIRPYTVIATAIDLEGVRPRLRSCFEHTIQVKPYSTEELCVISARYAEQVLNAPMSDDACAEIVSRSQGSLAILTALVRRVRDYAQVKCKSNGSVLIGKNAAVAALELMFPNE